MQNKKIIVKGAKANNLKNIDLEIPRDKLVVFTGLSGSGKSSLAFDTIYAEGQRRYIESLSSYARQFLGQMDKPDVEYIEGLSPAISIDQKTTSKNPRSTVGTVTEIYDYLRLIYARIGTPHCPVCGREISMETVDGIVDKVLKLPEGEKIFGDDVISDRSEKFMISEIMREKILLKFDKEIPHGVVVKVNEFKLNDNGVYEVNLDIICSKPQHKAILIGKGGSAIKAVSSYARQDMEKFLGRKVFLTTYVLVKEGWKDTEASIKEYGYYNPDKEF